jgi:putative DNA methylase
VHAGSLFIYMLTKRMKTNAVNKIQKVDYTAIPHPSGVHALSLKDTPALIESLLPVQKLSVDVFNEREARQSQTLTALGSYWKGRKPLVLNKACVLASLLPVTNDPIKDLEVFELLMGMDDISISKRLGLAKPDEIVRVATISDISIYFVEEPPGNALPMISPFDIEDYAYRSNGKDVFPKLRWRSDIPEARRHEIAALTFETDKYRDLAKEAKRAEELADEVSSHIWAKVNSHLCTNAFSFPDLVEQLGVMRFGHRPTVADTFSGSGQIPFAAAQLGCDVYASDLNPIACMLTWGSFNIVGAQLELRKKAEAEQAALVRKVKAEIDELGFETDGNGWRGKVYLYCLEVTCPSSGWKVPILQTRVVSKGKAVYAKLIPIHAEKRYDIELVCDASPSELKSAEAGTYRKGSVVHVVDGVEHVNSISSIRGDYVDGSNGKREKKNRLRLWDKSDVAFRNDDIFSERLYAIQWIKELKDGESSRAPTEFRSVTQFDLSREIEVTKYVKEHLSRWQNLGWVPDTRIEPGEKTDEPIRTRGWTYWHHLFNPRQLLIASIVRRLTTSTGVSALTQALNVNSRLSRWNYLSGPGQTAGVFDNQALNTNFNFGTRGVQFLENTLTPNYHQRPIPDGTSIHIGVHAATDVCVPADIFISDPPYGDAVKYEEILEFFIAWLRKNPPDEFSNWTWDSRRELAVKGEDHDFRLGMVAAYKRMTECMVDNGIQILMFTHQDGDIWADMANIVWASGLRVTAAWYLVTETDSALREGAYVKGTILLVLRKRLGAKRTNQTDLAYELEDEVADQIKRLTGMNDTVVADSKRAKDGNLFEDADLQMAGYAAALKVLTQYSIIDGKDMAQEALRPRVPGQVTLVESLIAFATDTANKMLVPLGLDESVWHDLEPAERFYLKMLEQESHGLNKLDNYQNFAKAFSVRNFSALMGSESANKAALRSAKEFGRAEMNQSSELFQTPTRAVLYALMDLQAQKDLELVLKGLEQNLKVGAFYSSRNLLVAIARFIGKKVDTMRPDEASAARVLADGIENQRL